VQRSSEQLKAIRRGEWSMERLEDHFAQKEKQLESIYLSCDLPAKPQMDAIRQLLLDCYEQYYGSMAQAVARQDGNARAINDIRQILNRLDKE
jgi:CHASE3 domain sensor protein